MHKLQSVWLCLLISPVSVLAQSTSATITGTVTDPAGAAVSGATIQVTQNETNFRFSAISNDSGQYTVANIPDGTYTLRVNSPGFQGFVATDIILTGRDIRRIDPQLALATVGTTVEVSAGATLIETETARIADTKNREVMRALPLTLRRAWDYFTMTPQVERTSSWHISISGSRNNQSIAAIDGTPINDAGGGTGIGPLMDKTEFLQEMRIDMAQGSAEQMTMGQVTLISRSGSNDFHGALSDYYSTPAFRARNPFQNSRSPVRQHIVTASAGGPIWIPKIYNGRNRSFFFLTYEGTYGSTGVTNFVNGVPLERWRRGDFSSITGLRLIDPATGSPFPNNIIPASRINPVSQALQERFYPLPNFGDSNQFTNSNYRDMRQAFRAPQPTITTRIDQKISDQVFVTGRWTAVRWNIPNYDTNMPTVTELFTRRRDMDAITGAYTHTLSSNLINEFRYGFTRQDFPIESPLKGASVVNELGLRGLQSNLPDVGGMHRVSFTGVGITPLGVSDTCQPCGRHRIHNFTENLSWFRGSHSIKMGFYSALSMNSEQRQNANLFGATEYTSQFTGHPYADFLLGMPSTMQRAAPSVLRQNRRWDYSLYFTDEWKLAPTLTLTMGVRWDVHRPWTEASGLMAVFDPATANLVVPNGSLGAVSPLVPANYIGVVEASQAGLPSSLVRTDWNNLAPRVGAAWRPFGNNTVFRGGFGIYYDTAPWQPSSAGAPFVLNEPVYTNPTDNPLVLPNIFPAAGSGGPARFTLPNAIRPDLRIPYSMQYSATAEHQRWNTGFRLTYTGTNTRQGIYRWNMNQPVPDERLFVNKPRMFPQYPEILYADNGAGHQYHGVTLEVERRMRNGVHFQAFYTHARDIGDLERGEQPENAYDRRRERAVWERFPSDRISANVIYELPFGRGRALGGGSHWLLNGIFGGWNLSGIAAWETGRYITPLWRGPDPTGTAYTDGPNRPIVTIRPDQLRDGRIDNPSIDNWFDASAFAAPPIGRFGTSAKGVLQGAPTEVLHASIAKHFVIRERARLRLEMLATNVLNHPNYQDPNTRIDQTGAVGRVTAVIDRNIKFDSAIPRELQAQIRLEW